MQDRRGRNPTGENMIIPIRCWSCGKPIAQLYEDYKKRVEAGENPKEVMDDLGMKRYCCRGTFLGQVDLIDTVSQFRKF